MRFLIVVILVLGIFFRFANLDRKLFWYDEAFTSLRASGYTEEEVVKHFAQTSVVSVTELEQFQHPNFKKSSIDTIQSLAKEDPQHPPLYYLLAKFWFQGIGSSIATTRLLPAFLSLLAFPSIYWLCQELFVKTGLFNSSLPAWVAIALVAVSPFQILYAQESRQYILWGVTTLVSTTALLRAIRLNTKFSWGIYALTLAMDLYTFLFAGLVAIAHGIYVIVMSKFRLNKTLIGYLGASLLALIAFLPWAIVVKINLSQAAKVTNWTNITTITKSALVNSWVSIYGRNFLDFNIPSLDLHLHRTLLILVGYAFYCLFRQTPISVWLLITLLTLVPALALILPDLISGGMRSITARYFIPSLLAVQLAMAYLLSHKFTSISLKFPTKRLWQLIALVVISGSILSCAVSSQRSIWWHRILANENLTVAPIINQATRPLLVSDAETASLMSLSHLLKSSVQIFIRPRCNTCNIASSGINLSVFEGLDGFSDVFLFRPDPPKELLSELKKQEKYKFEPVAMSASAWAKNKPALWKVIKL